MKEHILSHLAGIENGYSVCGIVDRRGRVYPLGTDTKVLSTIFELIARQAIVDYAQQEQLFLIDSSKQNYYPDFTLAVNRGTPGKIAIDVKTTYRNQADDDFGFTLGSYTSFLRNGTKNIMFPFHQYSEHWIIGFVYRRVAIDANAVGRRYSTANLAQIPAPFSDVEVFMQEKWKTWRCAMKANYDAEADVLSLATGIQSVTSASLLDDPDIVVDLAEADGHDIVGLAVMWASAYLPLEKGYDPETDTLLLGTKNAGTHRITEHGDFIGYWQVNEDEPDSFMDPVGVLIRNASKHLAQVIANSTPKMLGGQMKYDVIVIGGGSAGSVVAARLSENPQTSVLLLEAGPDYPDPENLPDDIRLGHTRTAEAPDSRHNWALTGILSEEQGPAHVAQGKVIGGGGSINGQVFLRGLPEDFDLWVEQGAQEWAYLDVLPYYRKIETDLDIQDDFHGSDGPLPITRRNNGGDWPAIQSVFHAACLEAGHGTAADMNGPDHLGVTLVPMNNMNGVRMSTALTHLSPARHRLNLTVRGNVFVRRLVMDGKRAVGVEAESGGETFIVQADKIVLSAGALRSPHLLMLSGVGPREQLDEFGIPLVHEAPGVGQNLWNHAITTVSYRVKEGVALAADNLGTRIALRYTAEGSPHVSDMMMTTSSVFNALTGEVMDDGTARVSCVLELPEGSGWVRLASADPSVQPSFNYRYFEHPEDTRRLRDGVRLAAGMLETEAYQGICEGRIAPTDDVLNDDDSLDLWMKRTVGSARHVSGTCKIGLDDDPMAVVDQRCKVRGIEGVWVADSSVIPRVPRANTNATAIMIGERVADWLS